MTKKPILIKKNSKQDEPFAIHKLEKSLRNCGASHEEINAIIFKIQPSVHDGISTNDIYDKAFELLKSFNSISASKYSLKRALFQLGPTGYPFERLVGTLLQDYGFKTQVGVVLKGKCVNHEVDVLAEKDGASYPIECKFHLESKVTSNVKVPLYINSRFLDLQQEWNANSDRKTHLKQGWLVTNTRFSEDAITYGKCVGMTLLSWDYPENNGLKSTIDSLSLYPVTTLLSLNTREKELLISNEIILVKELLKSEKILKTIGIADGRIPIILREVRALCNL